jgi:hypothetical protein
MHDTPPPLWFSARVSAPLAACLLAVSASAQITVSNWASPGNAENEISAYAPTAYNPVAAPFTTDNATYSLNSVILLLSAADNSSPLTVSIYSAGTSEPGSLLETLSGANPATPGYSYFSFSSTGLTLTPNTTYYIVAATSGLGYYTWSGSTSSIVENTPGATWSIHHATYLGYPGASELELGISRQLSITATAVPEPGAFATLAGLVALGFAAWRRCRCA